MVTDSLVNLTFLQEVVEIKKNDEKMKFPEQFYSYLFCKCECPMLQKLLKVPLSLSEILYAVIERRESESRSSHCNSFYIISNLLYTRENKNFLLFMLPSHLGNTATVL